MASSFPRLSPALSYRQWAVLFALVSFLIANIGLNQILTLSLPVLNIIYPVAIVLILLSFFHRFLARRPRVYPVTILFTGVASFLLELERLTALSQSCSRSFPSPIWDWAGSSPPSPVWFWASSCRPELRPSNSRSILRTFAVCLDPKHSINAKRRVPQGTLRSFWPVRQHANGCRCSRTSPLQALL